VYEYIIGATIQASRICINNSRFASLQRESNQRAFREFAADLGEPNPTDVQHDRSTLAEAERDVFGSAGVRKRTPGSEPVLVIRTRGSFTGTRAPAGAASPTGTVLTTIVSVKTGFLYGYGIGRDKPADPA
jgi:hypothetical protein